MQTHLESYTKVQAQRSYQDMNNIWYQMYVGIRDFERVKYVEAEANQWEVLPIIRHVKFKQRSNGSC